MESSAVGAAGAAVGGSRAFNRGAAITRSLLGYGVIAGPFYLIVGVVQGLVRDGFSFSRHPLSVLSNGHGGWVQTANFAITGAMVIAAAVGIARVLGKGRRAMSWALGVYGLGIFMASIFRADPMDGFPPGTPMGSPTSMTTMGLMHFVFGGIGFTALAVAAFLAARAMSKRGDSLWARLSLLTGVIVVAGFHLLMAFQIIPSPVLGIWIAVVVGWAWLSALSVHLYRVSPDPNCEPAVSS